MNKIMKKITAGTVLCTMLAYATPVLAYTKDETVYSKINENGEKTKTIVTDHLSGEEELVNDLTDLLNIKNVSGEEEFSQDGNKIIWKTNGNDVYYQGESQKELPVECNIKYELDGKEMSKDEITGKSGKVKITIQYTNKEEHTVKIEGKNTTLYTPFIVGCGTMFNNDKNKNVEITNGKVVNDGSKTTAVGIVVPGLQESLGLDKAVINIPDSIEITMDTTEFEMGTMVAYITPKVLENSDLEIFDKLEEIYSQVDTLKSASKQIEDGANTLVEGTTTYSEKSKEFNNAMSQVSEGIENATNSYNQLDNGIDTLNKSAGTLTSGAKKINDGTKALSSGINSVDTNVGKLSAGVQKLEVGENKISAGVDRMKEGISTIDITNAASKIKDLQQLNAANQNTVKTLKATNETLTKMLKDATDEETKATLQKQITSNTQLIGLLNQNINAQNETIETLSQMGKLQELSEGLTELETGVKSLQEGTETLGAGLTELKAGTETLAKKIQELSAGTSTLYSGTKQISTGTKTLKDGSTEMKSGLNTINGATSQLLTADNSLTEGAETIAEGAKTLANGIKEFNTTGINKICNFINSDVKNVTNRLQKLEELSNEYSTFTMKDEEVKGNVQFIMLMDDSKKDE